MCLSSPPVRASCNKASSLPPASRRLLHIPASPSPPRVKHEQPEPHRNHSPAQALVFFFLASPSASGASLFLPLLAGFSVEAASFLLAGLSAAFLLAGLSAAAPFLLAGFSADAAAAFLLAGFSVVVSFFDAGLSAAAPFLLAGLSAAFLLAGFSVEVEAVSFLDAGLSAAFLDAGFSLSAAFFDAGLSDAASFLDAGFSLSADAAFLDAGFLLVPLSLSPAASPFFSSFAFLPSLFGSGGPDLGSFLDPASFSYPPPSFSYSDDSLDACDGQYGCTTSIELPRSGR